MTTIKIKPEGDAVVSLSKTEVVKKFAEFYPDWAAEFAVDSMMDIEDFEFIDMGCAQFAFQVLDIDTAASVSGMGGFDADTWTDEDEDDAITSWIEDIEMNLDGFICSNHNGHNTEFFVKNL